MILSKTVKELYSVVLFIHFQTFFAHMSKFGETADSILEQLNNGKKLRLNELEKKISLNDMTILHFMNEYGLIELENEYLKITEFGSTLLILK